MGSIGLVSLLEGDTPIHAQGINDDLRVSIPSILLNEISPVFVLN